MARVIWSERALADLESLLVYLEVESPVMARRYAAAVVGRVEQLEQFPESGGVVEELPSSEYRQLLQGPYRIIYRREEGRIVIITVHHSARLLEGDLER